MIEEKVYQIALGLIPGVGNLLSRQLISYCGSAKEVFTSPPAKIKKIPGIGSKVVDQLRNTSTISTAEMEYKKCLSNNIRPVFYTESDYPSRLKRIIDAPPLLFLKGNGTLECAKTVGIVGTRNATAYGKAVVEELCKDLASLGVATISGLAYGIDVAAHKASLKNGIPTFGVIASGIDHIYPAIHKTLSNDMLENGGLVTENRLGVKPEAHFFPARNRIIAGLSDALIVIESDIKGGSLITANIAFSYNKDLFAVPGNINQTYSKGCNQLIVDQKAIPYTKIQDLIINMNWDDMVQTKKKPDLDLSKFDEKEAVVIEVLRESTEGILLDQLAWKTQITINKLSSILLTLEFQGLVKSLPGKKYKWV